MQPPENQASRLDRQAERLSAKLAESTTRLSFLGRLSTAALAIAGGSAVAAAVKPDEADAFHFCGHIWTTGSCPSPYPPLSRIDRKGFPLHPQSGKRIDNLGRRRRLGRLRDRRQRAAPARPRRRSAPARTTHPGLRGLDGRGQGPQGPAHAGLVVSLLRRADPQARGLLLLQPPTDQRRRLAHRLLLGRAARVLRHVLRHGAAVLIETGVALAALVAGVSGAWSP